MPNPARTTDGPRPKHEAPGTDCYTELQTALVSRHQLMVQSVRDVTSFTKIRLPEMTGCVHVSLPATL